MTAEEIAGTLANHEQRIVGAEKRIKDLEETQKEIRTLTISVERMAITLENMVKQQKDMVDEQKRQNSEIEELKDAPAKSWNSMKQTAFTSIVSTIAGALAVGMIMLLTNYIG